MANNIPELGRRKETDRRLSFGIYLIVVLIMIALLIAVSVSMGVYFWAQDMPWKVQYSLDWGSYYGPWFPLNLVGWVIAIGAIGIALSVINWWYQWQLYNRD